RSIEELKEKFIGLGWFVIGFISSTIEMNRKLINDAHVIQTKSFASSKIREVGNENLCIRKEKTKSAIGRGALHRRPGDFPRRFVACSAHEHVRHRGLARAG